MESKKEWPLTLPDAAKIISVYLSHPLNILARQHAFVRLVDVSPNRVLLNIYENATAAGLPNFGKGEMFCDFMAGYIGGRIDMLTKRDVIVRELECHGTGHNHSQFEIAHV